MRKYTKPTNKDNVLQTLQHIKARWPAIFRKGFHYTEFTNPDQLSTIEWCLSSFKLSPLTKHLRKGKKKIKKLNAIQVLQQLYKRNPEAFRDGFEFDPPEDYTLELNGIERALKSFKPSPLTKPWRRRKVTTTKAANKARHRRYAKKVK